MEPNTIVMVAGEASGDMHGANVVRALKRMDKNLFICGIGSRAMRSAGAKILIDADQLAVVGITEAVAKAPQLLKARSRLKGLLSALKPSLLILIDFPDFNLSVAGIARKLGIPVLYYISPQIWAWRAGRVKKIKANVDHMAVILPFEKRFYEDNDVPVSFVGHPLMDTFSSTDSTPEIKTRPEGEAVIGLLPGSRDREVSALLPAMLKSAQILEKKLDSVRFLVSCAPSADSEFIDHTIAQTPLKRVAVSKAPAREIFHRSHLAIVASGTVTLEAAICGTPMIITYAVSPISYWLGRLLIRVEHIGLVNLIAQNRIVPELVQDQVTPEIISRTACHILTDEQTYANMCQELAIVRDLLGSSGASEEVARIAMDLVAKSSQDALPAPEGV